MVKAVIVEDEKVHSDALQEMLRSCPYNIEIKAIASNIDSAVKAIEKHKPELVFLDICLNENLEGGFDMLKRFKSVQFDVIFTTAHVDHNIEKIRANGLDHIMKPYYDKELNDALDKFINKHSGHIRQLQLEHFMRNLAVDSIDEQTIWLYDKKDYEAVKIKDILYCEGKDQATVFFLVDQNIPDRVRLMTVATGIGEWERKLSHYKIYRIHRSYLVNYKHIKRYSSQGVKLNEYVGNKHFKPELPVSSAYKDELLKLMGRK